MEGSSRRGLGGLLCALALVTGAAFAADSAPQPGTFALIGGTAAITANMSVKQTTAGLAVLERQFNNGAHILQYTVEMQHPMHMVLVRDDFATFEHKHPAQDVTTGSFHETFTGLDASHRYYLFADSTPTGLGHQVFRFTLQGNNIAAVPPASTLAASSTSSTVGPYVVHISKTSIPANVETKLVLNIEEHGKPAHDLAPYLGVPAHIVVIDAQNLGYLHVHPYIYGTNMQDAMKSASSGEPQSGPILEFDLPALAPGPYKLWAQFAGGGLKVYTAPFTLLVQ